MPRSYVLRRPEPGGSTPPVLDATQRAVVEHPGGPLLVLAGPGTGKTTTLVEAVAARIQSQGLAPERVLVLTFSRRAAEELRSRIATRLGPRSATPPALTFHSFCYGLVRRLTPVDAFGQPMNLLSAPEQDVRIRELLRGTRESAKVQWPAALDAALRARGMAPELQRLLSRARTLGMEPGELAAAGEVHERPEWVAAGEFFAEYLDVMDAQGLVDYTELVHRAGTLLSDPVNLAALRAELALVVVDEYQDTDPAQVALLHRLAGDGRDLIAFGDPDQSIYAFRGAEVRGILEFPREFRSSDGVRAPVVALASTRRFGSGILAASRAIATRLPLPPGLDEATREAFRHPAPLDPPYGDGRVDVRTFTSPGAEAEHIADLLRRAHLDDGLPWSSMAVLVRSGARFIPRLRRALGSAGVPVEVAGDELPLRAEPAVQVLLRVLRVAERLHRADHEDDHSGLSVRERARPTLVDPEEASTLLTSPLCGMDPAALRRLARALRRLDDRPSGQLLAEALVDTDLLTLAPPGLAAPARRLAALLRAAADQLRGGEPPEQVLWQVWHGSRWPRRLAAAVEKGGAAARSAHRDLDAVCALFDLAARAEERQRRRGLGALLDEIEDQQIPAQTLAEQAVRGQGVRLLTAHRAKGLEWRLVVVAGVQERLWPDLRRRGSLLRTDQLAEEGLRMPPSTASLLAAERRLFYVALTRAQERVVVTAVASSAEEGDQPSRFLTELRPDLPAEELRNGAVGRPLRPLSLRGLLGELRLRIEQTDDPAARAALARRIARLAAARSATAPRLPAAHPDSWWGVAAETRSSVPVRPAAEPLALSGSAVDSLARCPLRWFLAREAGGETAQTSARGFGSIVHALAAAVHTGEVDADIDALDAHLDRVWGELDFAVPWADHSERQEAHDALVRFLAWHGGHRGRSALAAEHPFAVTFTVAGEEIMLRGSMDRVELDADGRVVVIDFKTGKSQPSHEELAAHPQLGAYQLAVLHGAADDLVAAPVQLGGAELVQLRKQCRGGAVKVQRQEPLAGDLPLAESQLVAAARSIRSEDFAATTGPHCGYCEFATCCPAQLAGLSILSAGVSPPARSSDG
ncbi:MAG: ATP-dependent helicase [Nocardioidaceae bacterium]